MINTHVEKFEQQYETITRQVKTLKYRIHELEEEKKKFLFKY